MSILLLEDEAELRVWLSELLARLFPQALVMVCTRREQALACIDQGHVDLALVDLGLRDGCGVDLVERLQGHQAAQQTVVVAIHDDDRYLFPALEAGAFGYILKGQNRTQFEEQPLATRSITSPSRAVSVTLGRGSALGWGERLKWLITRRAIDGDKGGSPLRMRCSCSSNWVRFWPLRMYPKA
ncbi:MAG: response regulator, partial [Betaproteobacteria bacterium]